MYSWKFFCQSDVKPSEFRSGVIFAVVWMVRSKRSLSDEQKSRALLRLGDLIA